ncbi:MAG: RNA polymerase sigma factor [Candidatus Kaiserbacteria bacterium]|nr:RNA polymerase sigma factor [Candidatus Kaiserbacteria bacterium]MCB9816363.1 RNA polymerase sigma factor [Candidatus Nomurabacteria bacterium]
MLGFSSTEDAREWEDELVLAKSQSSPWLFEIIVDRYQEPFTRKVRGVVRDPRDAEEVVQDAFTKIYINADKYEPQSGAKFSSWAYRILLNTAFTRYQKLVKERERFQAIDPEYEQMYGEWAEHSGFEEKRDGIERILERLPGHFALVLRLHYLERWSHQDIAEHTGENTGTIKARIHRAKAAFKKEGIDKEIEVLLD